MNTNTNTFPLKYRRKSSPPPSPRMLSPISPFSSSFVSPQSKWLDSDDDLDHEPALTSDDALTVLSSSCSRAPSLAPLDAEDSHVDIVSSPVRETFFRAPSSSRAPLPRFSTSYPSIAKSSTTREDVATALLALHAQPRLGPSRPLLVRPPTHTEIEQPPPARRSRVVTPSLRNLVLPRTPSPPPRTSLPLTTHPSVIDHHAITPPAQRTPARRRLSASSPLPPSSPFVTDADYEASEPMAFHPVPCSKPKLEPFQACTLSDDSEADRHAPPWSCDEPKGECDGSLLVEHEVALEASHVTAAPNERHLAHEPRLIAPPVAPKSSSVLSPKSGDQHKILLPEPDNPNGAGPESWVSAALSPPARAPSVPPLDGPSSDIGGADAPAIPSPYSRAASSALTPLADENITSPGPPRDRYPAPSPLSSPPWSPSPEQHRQTEAPSSPSPPPKCAGAKRQASTPLPESDPAVSVSVSASAPSARVRPRTKRRRRDPESDDKPWRDRKKQVPAAPKPAQQPSLPVSACLPVPTSPPYASSSSTASGSGSGSGSGFGSTTRTNFSTPPTTTSTTKTKTTDPSPTLDDADDHDDHDANQNQPCPHPALLGTLVEALALSRASSLPLSTLTRTTPALAGVSHAVLTSTLEWAVRARVLGCVRSSGEALPPSYFYDPATDPDRERGELLRSLMPRAGKRRETMKYKQYYWAPVVVGRGRTRTWDVDWEE